MNKNGFRVYKGWNNSFRGLAITYSNSRIYIALALPQLWRTFDILDFGLNFDHLNWFHFDVVILGFGFGFRVKRLPKPRLSQKAEYSYTMPL